MIEKMPQVTEGTKIERAIGGTPLTVLTKLVLLSLLVGLLFAVFGMTSWEFVYWLRYWIEQMLGSGFEAIRNLFGYIVSGAVVVVPVWLILRLLSRGSR